MGLSTIFFLLSCSDRDADSVALSNTESDAGAVPALFESWPLAERIASRESVPLFSKLKPEESGIHHENPLDTAHPLKRLYQSGFASGGVAIGDLDGDALPEVFFASGPRRNALYKQTAPFAFEDVADLAGVGGGEDAWASGVVFIDIDGLHQPAFQHAECSLRE